MSIYIILILIYVSAHHTNFIFKNYIFMRDTSNFNLTNQ